MTHVTCRLTAKNRDQPRDHTLGNRLWVTFYLILRIAMQPKTRCCVCQSKSRQLLHDCRPTRSCIWKCLQYDVKGHRGSFKTILFDRPCITSYELCVLFNVTVCKVNAECQSDIRLVPFIMIWLILGLRISYSKLT